MAPTALPAAAAATVSVLVAAAGMAAPGATALHADGLPSTVVERVAQRSEGPYHQDGVDRPFWWESDGLHFADPDPRQRLREHQRARRAEPQHRHEP